MFSHQLNECAGFGAQAARWESGAFSEPAHTAGRLIKAQPTISSPASTSSRTGFSGGASSTQLQHARKINGANMYGEQMPKAMPSSNPATGHHRLALFIRP